MPPFFLSEIFMAIAKSIITRAKTILQDTSAAGTRWPNSELQGWLNDAQKEVVLYRPDANTVNEEFTPTANASKQTIPSSGLRLIEVVRNTAATSDKSATRMIERSIMDDQVPYWHATTASVNIEHWVYDERDPKNFYVYPNPSSATRIEIVYSTVPAEIDIVNIDETWKTAANTTHIGLDDIYVNAILDFMLYRAYSKDAEYAGNAGQAQAHMIAFANALNVKTNADSSSASLRVSQGVN
jgi:hypothetical protein